MWCFKGEELDLLQRHKLTTAEKSFTCHSYFTQDSHVVEVDDAFRNNTVHVEPFMSRYTSVHPTTWRLFACFSAKFYRFITVIRYLSMNKEYEERFRNNLPQTHVIQYALQFIILHQTVSYTVQFKWVLGERNDPNYYLQLIVFT